jgi:hypothetical protein
LVRFIAVRPMLFHLTARANLGRIRREGRLESAAALRARAGIEVLARQRRGKESWVEMDGEPVHIRDQAPLYEGNIELLDGGRSTMSSPS